MNDSTERKGMNELPSLSDAAIEARRRYYREYARKNADKRKSWAKAHWERVAKQNATKGRQEDK